MFTNRPGTTNTFPDPPTLGEPLRPFRGEGGLLNWPSPSTKQKFSLALDVQFNGPLL